MRKCFWEPLDFRWSLGNVSLQNDTLLIHLEVTKNDFYMQCCKEESVLKLSRNSLQLWRFVNPTFSHGPIGADVLRMAWQLNKFDFRVSASLHRSARWNFLWPHSPDRSSWSSGPRRSSPRCIWRWRRREELFESLPTIRWANILREKVEALMTTWTFFYVSSR